MHRPEFVALSYGKLKVWDWPEDRCEYVVGADPALGKQKDLGGVRRDPALLSQLSKEKPDYSAAVVVDKERGRHVASWHGHINPSEFATVLAALSIEYHNALLVVERNTYGETVLDTLIKVCDYPNLYRSHVVQGHQRHEATDYGWATTASSRPMLIARIHEWLSMGAYTRDERLVKELRTMQMDTNGVARGVGNDKDDMVIALGLALQGRFEELYGRTHHDDKPKRRRTPDEKAWAWLREKRKDDYRNRSAGDRPRIDRRDRLPGGGPRDLYGR